MEVGSYSLLSGHLDYSSPSLFSYFYSSFLQRTLVMSKGILMVYYTSFLVDHSQNSKPSLFCL